MTIAVCCMGQLEMTKGQWGCLIANTTEKDQIQLLVVDNNSQDNTQEFLTRFVFPHFPDHKLIHNTENLGVIKSLDQCYRDSNGDIIIFPHNDLYILEYGWNRRVLYEFEHDTRLGLSGFLGCEGLSPDGGRWHTLSNLLEAEAHGSRITNTQEVIGFDGLCLIARREMLNQVGGFDQEYTFHHAYDRDISLTSYKAGWTNKVIPIYCHHRSGVTANHPDYGRWIAQKMHVEEGRGDQASYTASMTRFEAKWKLYLPRRVGER